MTFVAIGALRINPFIIGYWVILHDFLPSAGTFKN